MGETKNIIWEERTSNKGNKYEVGYLEGEDAQDTVGANEKHDFGEGCNWPPTQKEEWKPTTPDFAKKTAIVAYSVNNHDGYYKYIINFTNKEHYDYTFYDETGDSYGCNTFRNGDHYVRYNSDKPTIRFVTGS